MQIDHVKKLDGFGLIASGPLGVCVWDKTPALEHVQAGGQFLSRMARTHEQFLFLVVLSPGCPAPEGHLREMIGNELKRVEKHIRASSTVIEGDGFAAAALRGVIIGINLLIRPPYPMKVFGTISDSAEFLAKSGERLMTASDIREAVQHLRS